MSAEVIALANFLPSFADRTRILPVYFHGRISVMNRINRSGTTRCHLSVEREERGSDCFEEKACNVGQRDCSFPVSTLGKFPKEQLYGKVVLVRFDSNTLLKNSKTFETRKNKACFTIKYLHSAGAKVILTSSWDPFNDSERSSAKCVADCISEVLQLKVTAVSSMHDGVKSKMDLLGSGDILLLENLQNHKEEFANSSDFSKRLSEGVDIFVNDTLSQSHKILASTVGVTHLTDVSIAGFQYEEELSVTRKTLMPPKRPYVAIIGGGNLFEKRKALRHLILRCDALVFIGRIAFQFMHALGWLIPPDYLEYGSTEEAFALIQLAEERNVSIHLPKDFLCRRNSNPNSLIVTSSNHLLSDWKPVDLGPRSLDELSVLLLKSKMIFWIGPANIGSTQNVTNGEMSIASLVSKVADAGSDAIVVGPAACRAFSDTSHLQSLHCVVDGASVMWEFLKGRRLPGVAALDKADPLVPDWESVFSEPSLPLFVDIGSGNGLFLFRLSRVSNDRNLLGLEINKKLVYRCISSIRQSGSRNLHFINTNATTGFHRIVSRYGGLLKYVSIQCPNPDFHIIPHKWRFIQPPLVEAIADLLSLGGKIFLQSDIEEVASRMKQQFITYSNGRLSVCDDDIGVGVDSFGWLQENPFGVRSDWEQHVIDRGDPMYRIMLCKTCE